MRFADRVQFKQAGNKKYNTKTGRYIADGFKQEEKLALVTDASTETVMFAYGGFKKGVLVVRIKTPLELITKIDEVQITGGKYKSDKTYKVKDSRNLRGKLVFILEEVV